MFPARRPARLKSIRSRSGERPDGRKSLSRALPDPAMTAAPLKARLKAFFVDRLGLDGLQTLAAKKRVPIHRSSVFYFLGGMALFLFGIQSVSGVLLSLYYKPSPDHAFESVRAIMTEVDFGWLIRSAHVWSANLLIGVLFLHVLTKIGRASCRER